MTVLADIGIGPINIPTPGDVVTALKNAVVDVADAVFDKIIEWIAGLLADAVSKVTDALVTLLATIKPTLTPGGAITDAAPIQASILGLAAALVALFFLFRIIHGLITGQAGQTLRATIIDLPTVVVGTLFFGFLCYTLLTLVDRFSDPLITDYAASLDETVKTLYSQDGIVQGGIFVIIFALLYIIAAVFLCFELFVRSSLIYLVIMFAPLAIATRVWGPTRSYARRAIETAVALIFSKLAIAVTLATGASLMAGATETGGNVAMIQGSAILLLAAFMPFALVRVIPMMEGAVAGEGVARSMGAKAGGGALLAAAGGKIALKPAMAAAGAVSGQGGSSKSSPTSTAGGVGDGGDGGSSRAAGTAGNQSKPGGGTPSSGGAASQSSSGDSASPGTSPSETNTPNATLAGSGSSTGSDSPSSPAPGGSGTAASGAANKNGQRPRTESTGSGVRGIDGGSTSPKSTPDKLGLKQDGATSGRDAASGVSGPREIRTPTLKPRPGSSTAPSRNPLPSPVAPNASANSSGNRSTQPAATARPVPQPDPDRSSSTEATSVPLAKSRTLNRPAVVQSTMAQPPATSGSDKS
jgi:type IV secretion system protein TrbL